MSNLNEVVEMQLYITLDDDNNNNKIHPITISNYEDIFDMVEIYMNLKRENILIKFNGKDLDLKKSFNENNIKNGDILTIKEKTELYHELEQMRMDSMIQHTMLYIDGVVNNFKFKLFVDTGAQASIMTYDVVKLLDMEYMIDKSMKGVLHGVGEQETYGKIYGCNIKLDDKLVVPINFHVTDIRLDTKMFILLGLDFLYSTRSQINLGDRTINIYGKTIKLLNEIEISGLEYPINIKKKKIECEYLTFINQITQNERESVIKTLNKIIDNIMNNPSNDKYKSLNRELKFTSKPMEMKNMLKCIGFNDTGEKIVFQDEINNLHYLKEVLSC